MIKYYPYESDKPNKKYYIITNYKSIFSSSFDIFLNKLL